ncbi:hypothetical protein KEM54_006883 [Ascosphaera aggregata]|nr:hypothetical protein KEM54_006883 [Ascosphaera aggregata]
MATWMDQYLSVLIDRDDVEKAHQEVYDAYTRLADRVTCSPIQHSEAAIKGNGGGDDDDDDDGGGGGGNSRLKDVSNHIIHHHHQHHQPRTNENQINHQSDTMRKDLAEAQKSRAELQHQLTIVHEEIDRLKNTLSHDDKKISLLQLEIKILSRRLKDRDEELKMKAKLLDDVQNEVVSLDLQLNMAEEKAAILKRENDELVSRWMARMKLEADDMNKLSDF